MDDGTLRPIPLPFRRERTRTGVTARAGAFRPEADIAAIYLTVGRAMLTQRRYDTAAQCARCALSHDPHTPKAYRLLGEALSGLNQPHAAARCLSLATATAPEDAAAYRGLGRALSQIGQMDAAATNLRLATVLAPEDAETWIDLGQLHHRNGQPALAAACFVEGHKRQPNRGNALVALGMVLHTAGQSRGGCACFRLALIIDPAHDGALRALAEVADEPLWSRRTLAPLPWPATARTRRLAVPEWRGQPLSGRSLFLWSDGADEIAAACRYADVISTADLVTIECDRRLTSLFARSFPRAVIRPRQPERWGGNSEVVNSDLHLHAQTLARRFPVFPARTSWLYADTRRVADWNGRLAELGDGIRVGLAWHGMTGVALERWGAVLMVAGLTLVTLQPGDTAINAAERRFGVPIHRWNGLDLAQDIEQTAALISALDLVIAPPGPVADLSGALGVPVWCIGGDRIAPSKPAHTPPTRRILPARTRDETRSALVTIGRDLRRLIRTR